MQLLRTKHSRELGVVQLGDRFIGAGRGCVENYVTENLERKSWSVSQTIQHITPTPLP
jgi:hypothetical protein